MVEDNEGLVGSFAHLALKVDDFLDLGVCERALRGLKCLTLLCGFEEETGVYFCLLVFQVNIASQDVAIVQLCWHIWMPATVIEYQSIDEFGLRRHLMRHVHNLDHKEINWLIWLLNGQYGVGDDFGELVGHLWVKLGAEGSARDAEEKFPVDFLLDFKFLNEANAVVPSELEAFCDELWV